MARPINPAVVGDLVREARKAAGLTQAQLADRIGASRFWVAAFEKGKPSVEFGLALKAIQALGMSIRIAPGTDTKSERETDSTSRPMADRSPHATLTKVLSRATLTHVAPSTVVGWPGSEPNA